MILSAAKVGGGVPQKVIQAPPPGIFFILKNTPWGIILEILSKIYRWKLFLSTPKVRFLNKLINLKFQKFITFLQKIFYYGTFQFFTPKAMENYKIYKKKSTIFFF